MTTLHLVPAVSAPPERLSTDQILLQRCVHGEEDAWSELVSRYGRLVYSIALREGLRPEDSHDVTQIVFVALLQALRTVRSSDSLAAWLVAVTRRQAWRIRDKAARERPVDPSGPSPEVESLAPHLVVDDHAEEIDRAVWLYQGLQDLGEPCRSLLLALYFDPTEPSYGEVAVRLGRPVGSIGPTRARCLDRLREVLSGNQP